MVLVVVLLKIGGVASSAEPDWVGLASMARSAALAYYEAGVIVAAHERWRYEAGAETVMWSEDGMGVEVRWGRTRHGEVASLVIRELPDAGMRYFVRTERKKGSVSQHVSIKGSDNAKNFRDDVDYAKVLDLGCRVRLHRGFKRVADAVWEDAAMYLEKEASIELTGHSLGGGVATILGMRLVAIGGNVTRVVSFGAPKVTNAHGGKIYAPRLPLLRVLTADDPIPTLPSMDAASQIFGFYRHFGHRLVLLDDDDDHDASTLATVSMAPTEPSGLARTKEIEIGAGRFASRPDPRWLSRERQHWMNFIHDPNWRQVLTNERKIFGRRVMDLLLWHLDESFFFHAHHVSPTAHTMDAYETRVASRIIAATPVAHYACHRKERPRRALKKRAPFLVVASLLGRQLFKYRRMLRVFKPKYLLISLLFVGWTGSGQSHVIFEKAAADARAASEREEEPAEEEEEEEDLVIPAAAAAATTTTKAAAPYSSRTSRSSSSSWVKPTSPRWRGGR
ncbi:hypothetical protein CTAYLR_000168 [Chrysophaeum taylorii]|uniref:Fungal lipase-type domain-containing protein n=1 Tax=Chrysophaeum taylorii TaxID=2483200 RepID=A0AAD7XN91_9STRA|nr:hypothetical protein CTAYLR_000168 [Chrysophaeum taylorii]